MDILGRRKYLDILLALRNKARHVRELQSAVGGSATTIDNRLKEMRREGLIYEEGSDVWPFRRNINLTPLGRETVEFMARINDFFNNRIPDARQGWILVLLYKLGNIHGSTRLEKLLFLFRHEFRAVPESFYNFLPHKYGPYSSQVIEDVKELERVGLLHVNEEQYKYDDSVGEWVVRKSYRLTEKGRLLARQLFDALPKKTKEAIASLQRYNAMPLEGLLRYVYDEYPGHIR